MKAMKVLKDIALIILIGVVTYLPIKAWIWLMSPEGFVWIAVHIL